MANIISFHSYKGGACRSTTCFNTIPYLAQKLGASIASPIILIDADLDSMGLTLLLTGEDGDLFANGVSSRGVFAGEMPPPRACRTINKIDDNAYYKQFVPVGNRFGLSDNGAVRFLGVNKADRGSHLKGDPSASTQSLFDVLNPLLSEDIALTGEFKGACAVIFDCATGIQHSAVLASKISDVIVVCLRPSIQFRASTFYYLNKKLPMIRSEGGVGGCKVVLLPTAVPNEPYISPAAGQLRREAQKDIIMASGNIKNYHWKSNQKLTLCEDMITGGFFGIPEVQRFKLKEDLLYTLHSVNKAALSEDEERARGSYEKLAGIIGK